MFDENTFVLASSNPNCSNNDEPVGMIIDGWELFPVTLKIHLPISADVFVFAYEQVYVHPFGEAAVNMEPITDCQDKKL
jgi:hypothetical protein